MNFAGVAKKLLAQQIISLRVITISPVFQLSLLQKLYCITQKNVNIYTKETSTYNSVHKKETKKNFRTYLFKPKLADFSKKCLS